MRLLVAVMLLISGTASAQDMRPPVHDHKAVGWDYDIMCCHNRDCRMVTNVRESSMGYIVPSGEIVPYADRKIKPSKDGDFHWCTTAGMDNTNTICLYVPPRSF